MLNKVEVLKHSYNKVVLLLAACAFYLQGCASYKASYNVKLDAHEVKAGDTLWAISRRYKVSLKHLININNISSPDLIKIGQIILIPKSSQAAKISTPYKKKSENNHVNSQLRFKQSDKYAIFNNSKTKEIFNPRKGKERTRSRHLHLEIRSWLLPTRGKVLPSSMGNGVDIHGRLNQPVFAVDKGRVMYAGNEVVGYGNIVIIQHNSQFVTVYAHNSKILVQSNQLVHAGQQIATMGSTGTNGVKLHFEVHHEGHPVDLDFLFNFNK